MIYQWKQGARIRANAQAAGEMCQELERNGQLSAKNLLDANRPEDAPLHSEFEWDDGIAAESWREQQARNIINSLIVKTDSTEPVRAFFKIENIGNAYHSINTILSEEDKTQKLLATALRELTAVEAKYRTIEKLSAVWESIRAAKENIGA